MTDAEVESLESKEKIYRLTDGAGMYLEIHPNGSKYWRFKYRFAGKEKRFAIGVYPEVTLKEARERLGRARDVLKSENDPSEYKDSIKGMGLSYSVVESRHIEAAKEALFEYCESHCSKSTRAEMSRCKGCAHGKAWKHFKSIDLDLKSKHRMPTGAEDS